MKVRMKDNLIMLYQQCPDFDYRGKGIAYDCMNELQAIKQNSWLEYVKTKQFLKSIEGKVVDLVFTAGDAFELNDNNHWLPNELWEAV